MSERPTFHVPTAAEWFGRFPDLGRTPLFTMRVRLGRGHLVTIRAYEGPVCSRFGHTRLFCELRRASDPRGEPLFPRESFYVGIPSHMSIDGKEARETVLSLFALKPGDTDAEFFDDYTDEQRAFACTWGDELSLEAERRFPGVAS